METAVRSMCVFAGVELEGTVPADCLAGHHSVLKLGCSFTGLLHVQLCACAWQRAAAQFWVMLQCVLTRQQLPLLQHGATWGPLLAPAIVTDCCPTCDGSAMQPQVCWRTCWAAAWVLGVCWSRTLS